MWTLAVIVNSPDLSFSQFCYFHFEYFNNFVSKSLLWFPSFLRSIYGIITIIAKCIFFFFEKKAAKCIFYVIVNCPDLTTFPILLI